MNPPSIDNLNNSEGLKLISKYIDDSWGEDSASQMRNAQQLLLKLKERGLSPEENSEADYFFANTWAVLRMAKDPYRKKVDEWEDFELEQELIFLRRAIHSEGFDQLNESRKVQVLTNLGGKLSSIGRVIEAIPYWDDALDIFPKFGMALGNKGVGLRAYANHLHNERQAYCIAYEARKNLDLACRSESTQPETLPAFEAELNRIKKIKKLAFVPSDKDIGKSKGERAYRKWCADNHLFVNPLNDLGSQPEAYGDPIVLPTITTERASATAPIHFDFFNILKQEYVSARYLMYLGQNDKFHYADRNVFLYDTYNYSIFSLATEHSRLAYRSAYSILDKISYFLWNYFELDNDERRVSFSSVWYKKGKKKNGLHDIFNTTRNWPLRGLFWLSKDLFEDNEDFKNAISPDAQMLHEIRNHLEHKFLSLRIYSFRKDENLYQGKCLPVTLEEFDKKTLLVLKTVRAAIIYLSMAIRVEEAKKKSNRGISVSMGIGRYSDNFKKRI